MRSEGKMVSLKPPAAAIMPHLLYHPHLSTAPWPPLSELQFSTHPSLSLTNHKQVLSNNMLMLFFFFRIKDHFFPVRRQSHKYDERWPE